MTKRINRCVAVLLLFALCLAPAVSAAEPSVARASDYLNSYVAYMHANGGGNVSVCFEVYATGDMDRVGVLTIQLQESKDGGATFTTIKRFSYLNYSNMTEQNELFCRSSVSYQGVAGRYYQAYVTVYAAKGSGSDSRTILASKIKAT